MKKMSTCLWFDGKAEEAARFYVSAFKNAKLGRVTRYGPSAAAASGNKKGSVMTVSFTLEGHEFLALNGGPHHRFSPAISIVVGVETQKELDRLWRKLNADPSGGRCGWLTDKFGLSWQIVPRSLGRLIDSVDPERSDRVMAAVVRMKKLDIAALEKARRGG